MSNPPPLLNVNTRVQSLARHADFDWVARVLVERRQDVLDRWLMAAAAQPFHQERPERAVADDIPRLFDALVAYLQQHAPPSVDAGAPLDQPEVREAAQSHARARSIQGLQPAEVVVEFRLLRQEIGRTLRMGLPDDVPADDITSATLLINDALDGAITLSLDALLRRVEVARQQLMATIMHDLRTPITAIKGFAQLMIRRDRSDSSMAQSILDASNRLQRMTDDLLEMGHLETGHLQLKQEPMDLVEMARSAVDSSTHLAPDHPIHLEAADTPIEGIWDQERLTRVLQNLLTNAVKYSPPNTEIHVRVERVQSSARVTVRDSGLGIPAHALTEIFDQFYRVREHASGAEGLGLGLFIAKSLVEAHGGRIWAESEGVGKGSTFVITLPIEDRPAIGG